MRFSKYILFFFCVCLFGVFREVVLVLVLFICFFVSLFVCLGVALFLRREKITEMDICVF